MADEKKTTESAESKRASKPAKKATRYFVVNPGGAVHEVTREHAAQRIKRAGWRMATDAEIEAYLGQAIQRADRPIATPFAQTVEEQASEE